MRKTLTIRISNEIGNQMFMYASSFAIAKKLNRELYIDNETAFLSKKNISKYALDNFSITSNKANKNFKFIGKWGYLRRKLLKKMNPYIKEKKFYIEPKDNNKITMYNDSIHDMNLSNNIFLEGYFETEKYFIDISDEIINEFKFINEIKYKQSNHYNNIIKNNSVSICLRQNRFIEGKKTKSELNKKKSANFANEQINFINKSIEYLKNKIDNPIFYLWSNDLHDLNMDLFHCKIIKVNHDNNFLSNLDKRSLDMFLISQCKHHIVIPSSFNWWGAWLSPNPDKFICRPSDNFFSDFKINNIDFWPLKWKEII